MKKLFSYNKFLKKNYSKNAASLATTMATLLVAFVVGGSYLFGFLAFPSPSLAQSKQIAAVGFGLEKAAGQADLVTNKTLGARIGSALKVVFNALGVVFLLVVVVAGLMWMTAAGNEETIRKSKQAIVAATIGFILVSLSGTLAEYFTLKSSSAPMPISKPSDAEIRKTGQCQTNNDCAEGELCVNNSCSDINQELFGACINLNPCTCSITQVKNCTGSDYYFIEGESDCSSTVVQNAIISCKNENYG